MLTVVFITVPYREAVLATHQGVPDAARVELDEGQEYRKVCLAVGIICKVVVPLGEVEVLSSITFSATDSLQGDRAAHLRYADAILVHPAQIPHREGTHLRIRRRLVVSGSLSQHTDSGSSGTPRP